MQRALETARLLVDRWNRSELSSGAFSAGPARSLVRITDDSEDEVDMRMLHCALTATSTGVVDWRRWAL